MRRVLVIGDLNIDVVASNVPRMPELGTEIFVGDIAVQMGGSSVLSACGLARLGRPVSFLGKVGDDQFGRFIRDTLALCNVDASRVGSSDPVRTGITIGIAHAGDRAFLTYSGSVQTLLPDDAPPECLDGFDHLHLASYYLLKPFQPAFLPLFQEARRRGMSTSFDTGCDPDGAWGSGLVDVFPFVDILLVNDVEATNITGCADWREAGRELAQHIPWLAVKLGAEGSCLFYDGCEYRAGSLDVEPVDTTGAGDSCNAGLIHGFLEGWPPERCVRLANVCGALSTQSAGGVAGQPTLEQAIALMDRIEVTKSLAE